MLSIPVNPGPKIGSRTIPSSINLLNYNARFASKFNSEIVFSVLTYLSTSIPNTAKCSFK